MKPFSFGDSFRPSLWPSVRWTAFVYFKRFFLCQSAMEFSPKVRSLGDGWDNKMMCMHIMLRTHLKQSLHKYVHNLST